MMNRKGWLAASALALVGMVAHAADNLVVKDGNATLQTSAAKNVGGVLYPEHIMVDSTGADATDTTNHAVKVNVVAGGTGGGPVTNAGTFAVQVTSAPTTAVTGTFFQATQPVSIATMPTTPVTLSGSPTVLLGAGAAAIGTVGITGTLPAFAATPTVNLGTLNGAATAANQNASESTQLTTLHTDLTTLNTTAGGAIPAGTNVIGKVGIDQTTPGTTNGVQVNAALPAGTNLIGKMGIDQTTPGTTNGVSQVAATPVTATLQSAAVANGNGVTLNTTGQSAADITVNCSGCSGGTTVNFEVTQDGTNYTAANGVQIGTATIASSTAAAGVAVWEFPVGGGLTAFRARISGYSAGTVTVTGGASPVPYNAKIVKALTDPSLGYAAIATGQVSVLTTAGGTLVAAARTGAPGTGRGEITVTDEGTASVWCGNSGVAIGTGALIAASGARTFKTTAALYCISAAATQVVDYVENF